MATTSLPSFPSFFFMLIIFLGNLVMFVVSHPSCGPTYPRDVISVHPRDVDWLQFALNLEHLEADFFLYGALGYGLDKVAPHLVMAESAPIGAMRANLDNLTRHIVTEFAYQEVGHLRAIKSMVGRFRRPLLDLSARQFARVFDEAFGHPLVPPFDPYANSINYMLSSYAIPYVGLNGYVGMNPFLIGHRSKRLVASLLGVESGQDAVIRMYLYERARQLVHPYNYTVAQFTARISNLRNRLGMCGVKDEPIFVRLNFGAANRTSSNVLSADYNSLSFARTPAEILKIVYGTGNEHVPGGFFPLGGNGKIARKLIRMATD